MADFGIIRHIEKQFALMLQKSISKIKYYSQLIIWAENEKHCPIFSPQNLLARFVNLPIFMLQKWPYLPTNLANTFWSLKIEQCLSFWAQMINYEWYLVFYWTNTLFAILRHIFHKSFNCIKISHFLTFPKSVKQNQAIFATVQFLRLCKRHLVNLVTRKRSDVHVRDFSHPVCPYMPRLVPP